MSAVSLTPDRFAVRAAGFAAFGIPAVFNVLFAAFEPYWLDAPEFAAAAQTLGMPHPPGHPLYVMLVKPFTLLPFGGIAFRVSLASALFGALATFILFHLIHRILKACAGTLPPWFLAVVSLSVSLVAAASPGWWFQCVRQEVYSLQILLVLGALYPFVLFCLRPVTSNERYLYVTAFVAGLGLTNHHFIMLATFPAAVWPIVALVRKKSALGVFKLTGRLFLVGGFGLLPYLFLPLRTLSGAPVSLGGVHSLSDFIWVVTAKVYQKSMTRELPLSLDERVRDGAFSMMGQVGPLIVIASLIGFYMLIRNRRTRMTGIVLTLVAGVTLLLRTTMGFDAFNPDYYGYMLPLVAVICIGFAVFAAVTFWVLKENFTLHRFVPVIVAGVLLILPLLRARIARDEVDLSRFRASRLFADFCVEQATPGTLILTSYYNLFFTLSARQFIDGSRPDLVIVNPMLLSYPGYLKSTVERYPSLVPLARTMLVHGRLTETPVAALALEQPLRIEPDFLLDPDVVRYMIPDGPVYHTAPEPLARSDVAAASPEYLDEGWKRFYRLLGTRWEEHETWRMLSWSHFQDAIFMARRGDHDGAMRSVEMAHALGNKAPELDALLSELTPGGRQPVDVSQFLRPSAEPKEPPDAMRSGSGD